MLKIKDDVDFKELEKFGFKYEPKIYFKTIVRTDECFEIKYEKDIYINEKTREISIQTGMFNTDLELNTIYDLITAGLVEKIEERNNK